MKLITKLLVVLITVSFSSCEKLFMEAAPGTDNLSVFDEYAKICIEKFGLESVKGIDLTQLADSLRPLVTNNLSEKELFDILGIFVDRMKEGHTGLRNLDFSLNKSYYYFIGYPLAMNPIIARDFYYGPTANPEVQILAPVESFFEIWYGFLPQDPEIGYIRITSFDMEISDDDLETMMAYLKDSKGIIIDVRGNFGGYIELAARMAGFFTTEEVEVGTAYIKNGPGKNDFASSKQFVQPSGSLYAYTKKVAVLHDRVTFSAGSLFSTMMGAFPNVTTVGQIFGGGTGDIMDGYLANGWKWTISTSNFVGLDGSPTDPGVEADIPMITDPADTEEDDIIERAILELQ